MHYSELVYKTRMHSQLISPHIFLSSALSCGQFNPSKLTRRTAETREIWPVIHFDSLKILQMTFLLFCPNPNHPKTLNELLAPLETKSNLREKTPPYRTRALGETSDRR